MTGTDGAWAPDLSAIDMSSLQLVVVSVRGRAAPSGALAIGPAVADALRDIVADSTARIAGMTGAAWAAQASWERDEYRIVQRRQLDDASLALQALERREHPDVDPTWAAEHPGVLYAIAAGPQPADGQPDERLLFVRKINPVMNLGRKVTVFWDGALRTVDFPLLSFDRNVDLVLAPGRGVLAVNGNAFELLFRDSPELVARTPEYARQLAAAVGATPATTQVLVDAAIGLARVRRRVLAIVERGHLSSVTATDLRAEFRRQGLDPAKYLANGRLSFGADDVPDVLRVLNEDLLTGGLSGQRFEVERKSVLP